MAALAEKENSTPNKPRLAWHVLTSPEGHTYYWNEETGHTRWTVPPGDTVVPEGASVNVPTRKMLRPHGRNTPRPKLNAEAVPSMVSMGVRHLWRALASPPNPMPTTGERNALRQRHGTVTPCTEAILTWRRSSLAAMMPFALAAVVFGMVAARDLLVQARGLAEVAGVPTPRSDELHTLADLAEHAESAGRLLVARVLRDEKHLDALLSAVFTAAQAASLVPMALSLRAWTDYRVSARLTSVSWLLACGTPFALGLAPLGDRARHHERVRTAVQVYMDDVGASFGGPTRRGSSGDGAPVASACAMFRPSRGSFMGFMSKFGMLCSSMATNATGGGLGDGVAVEPIARAQRHCALAIRARGRGDEELAAEELVRACVRMFSPQPDGPARAGDRGAADELRQRLERNVLAAVDVGVTLLHAGATMRCLLPVALSLAPGLLRGAIRTKALVPQSSIPGMFVLVLPWTCAPTVLCVYHVAFQLTRSVLVVVGLVFLALGPLAVMAVGWAEDIAKPISDLKMKRVGRRLFWCNAACVAVALAALFAMSARGPQDVAEGAGLLDVALSNLFCAVHLASVVVSVFANYLHTTVCGVDFMIAHMVEQHHLELYTRGEDVGRVPPAEAENVRALVAARKERLDELGRVLGAEVQGGARALR